MSQYKVGTVTVSGEYQVVLGAGTNWLSEVEIGNVFQKRGANVLYPIAAIDSNTQLRLQSNYAGSGEIGMLYTISRDFTPNLNLPEVNAGDIDWPFHVTTALRMIDSALASVSSDLIAKTVSTGIAAAELLGNTVITNTGAVAAINLTLPAGADNSAVEFEVTVAQYLKITANGTDKFRYYGEEGAAGGYVRSNEVGTRWKITWSGANWSIHDLVGVLSYDE